MSRMSLEKYPLSRHDISTDGAYVEEIYFSDQRLLIPIINMGISEHPIWPFREQMYIDYAYIVLGPISGISIELNGNPVDIPPRLGVFHVFDTMNDRCFILGGTNSREHDIEIRTDYQTQGTVYVRKHYKLSNQWHEFLPFAEEYGYEVAKNPYNKIILPAAETRSFFFDPPFDLLGGSYERLALY